MTASRRSANPLAVPPTPPRAPSASPQARSPPAPGGRLRTSLPRLFPAKQILGRRSQFCCSQRYVFAKSAAKNIRQHPQFFESATLPFRPQRVGPFQRVRERESRKFARCALGQPAFLQNLPRVPFPAPALPEPG